MDVDLKKVFDTENSKTGFPTALITTAAHGIMAFSEQVYDLNKGDYQAVINESISETINDLTTGTLATINGVDVKYGSDVTVCEALEALTDSEVDELLDEILDRINDGSESE